jgi:hypothetical protein
VKDSVFFAIVLDIYSLLWEKKYMFRTTRESVDCPCGGRHCNIPDIVRRHQQTKKHQKWVNGGRHERGILLPPLEQGKQEKN